MPVKSYDLGFKDVDLKQGIVTGYFANFGSVDSHGDIIEKGAFAKSLQERGPQGKNLIKWLLDHGKNQVIGKLLDIKEDSTGLYYEGKPGRHTLGKDFLLMVEDDLINQHSFGYQTVKEQYNTHTKANHLKELKIYEGSSIQFLGSNENTPMTGIKDLQDALEMCEKMSKFVRTSSASDETLIMLEKKLKSLQLEIEPLINTPPKQEPINIDQLKSELNPLFTKY